MGGYDGSQEWVPRLGARNEFNESKMNAKVR